VLLDILRGGSVFDVILSKFMDQLSAFARLGRAGEHTVRAEDALLGLATPARR
jgi:hypothetical protein